jgi:hypothetical protein
MSYVLATPSTVSLPINLATDVSGTLPTGNGGTNVSAVPPTLSAIVIPGDPVPFDGNPDPTVLAATLDQLLLVLRGMEVIQP